MTSLAGLGGELNNVQQQGGGAVSTAVAKQGQKLVEKGVKEHTPEAVAAPSTVTAYGSGNLAQVYFDLYPRKITLSELGAAYPGMVDALVQHEGIGLVCGYLDDGLPVVLGKGGQRNLHTGEVTGADPLVPYAPASGYGAASIEKRVWQLRRVMDFPHAGDLMVISSVYPDGTVAALEELIGNHGGVGGEQTDAFMLHPEALAVPETRNSIDVFTILNGFRGAPVAPPKPPEEPNKQVADWAPGTLAKGIADVRTWLGLALRCIVLERTAYEQVVRSPLMTGPALLITLSMLVFASIVRLRAVVPSLLGADIGGWLVAVLTVFAAGFVLTKKGTFTRTFRAMGFALSVSIVEVLAVFQPIASAVHVLTLVLTFLAVWVAASTAHETQGWRTIVLPIVAAVVSVVAVAVVAALLAGVGFTLESLLGVFGITVQ